MRNSIKTETELWELILGRLSTAVPQWRLETPRPRGSARAGWVGNFVADAWLELGIQGVQARLAVELRLRFEPRDVDDLPDLEAAIRAPSPPSDRAADARNRVDGRLLAAPFLSRRSQELLAKASWNYADATGNVRIALDRPAVFVQLQGAAKDPFGETRPLRSLKGPAAGRLVRALADFKPPCGVLDLADRAGASAAMASRVVALLEADAIVTREKRGAVTGVDWKALLERWCEEYSFARSNRIVRYLALRGRKPLLEKLGQSGRKYAITGGVVAERRRTMAPAIVTAIYSPEPEALARDCELVPATRVADVLIAEPFDAVVFERTWEEEGLLYVALTQAVADLLTSGDRDPQVGAALIEWMEANPDAWRA